MSGYDSTAPYPRDLVGYGQRPPHPAWPGRARLALQFVLNYEEGAEQCVLHGDNTSETFLSELANPSAYTDRHLSMESIYEYGSRAGVWRVLREFESRGLSLTVFGVTAALQRHPEVVHTAMALGHEIACHGLRWIHYQQMGEDTERAHMTQALSLLAALTGDHDRKFHGAGWYTGRDSPNTRRLLADHGGVVYNSDYYGDDLPFWMQVRRSDGQVIPQLIVPYSLDCNDMRFSLPQGFSHGDPFFQYLKDSFDVLYAEGDPDGLNAPKMMSVGLHARLVGRPGRMAALQRFLDHVQRHPDVWIARRIDIARHWHRVHPFATPTA